MAVSLFFLVWLFRFRGVDVASVWESLRGADYSWIILSLPVYFMGVWLRAVRWQRLLLPVKAIQARDLFPYTVLGFMANNVLPLRIGELVRAYLLGEKESISKTSILATILVERVLDALTLLFFALVISFLVPLPDWLRTMVTIAGLAFLGVLVLAVAATFLSGATLALTGVLVRVLPGSWRPRIENLVRLFLDGLGSLRQGRVLGTVSFLSLLIWLAETGLFLLVGYGFRLFLPFHAFLLTMSAANLGISVPSSQGGIGPFEFLASRTLSLFQVDPNQAVAYAFVVHAAVLVPITLLGFFYLWREHLSLSALRRSKREEIGEAV
ncbi:MAG: lysylphosphatidylglycerol synthase transmembrane domain-containing protein [Dehalococcoidia bacterium]|nr:lysylphosphatidylglycerol synthase transmembrane domain-containing protein [Dehalococcoidia bacterium]